MLGLCWIVSPGQELCLLLLDFKYTEPPVLTSADELFPSTQESSILKIFQVYFACMFILLVCLFCYLETLHDPEAKFLRNLSKHILADPENLSSVS